MQRRNNFLFFLIGSIGLHFAVLAFFYLQDPSFSSSQDQTIEITIQVDKPETITPQTLAQKVVETDSAAANNVLDNNAKFLSEKSNRVEKQTRAKSGAKFQNAKTNSTQPTNLAKTTSQKRQIFSNDFDAYAALQKQQVRNESTNASSGSQETSTTNDHLADVDDSLITKLNTREYKYFGYYNRIKNQLNQWWVPKVQEKFNRLIRQGRSIASEASKITTLVITLNDVGNLVSVQVLSESGLRDLDDAAVEAFRAAAPFPNPPKGIIENDGTVKIRWDCVVES